MAEYVDLNEAIIDFGFEWDDIAPTRDEFINFLKSRKRANVKKIVYAYWIEDDDGVFICSKCNNAESSNGRYCSYCGAEMIEVK